MQRFKLLSPLLFFILLLSSCKTQTSDTQEDGYPFNPYVEAFTTGKISRLSPVRLVFNQDVPSEKLDIDRAKKRIKFKPDVTGEFSWEDNRTLVFTPTKALERDTQYQLTADLSGWFPVSGNDRNFSFRFSTLPFRMLGDLESIKSNANDPTTFDIVLRFTTSDKESDELIESLVELSEKFENPSWHHHVNGKTHLLTLEKVAYREGQNNFIDVHIKKNKFNIAEQKILTFAIPSSTELDVYDVSVVNDSERYIQVSFTQPLDPAQEMEGLIFLKGGSSKVTEDELVSVDGNIVKIYPATNRKGNFEVHINKEVKSTNGVKLGKTVIESIRISEELPAVELVGKGVIIPQSDELIIPFRAVHLRGVVVRVIRIMENNVGQFLQINRLDQQRQLSRVGRLIARKTILLEEENVNLAQWNTFALDLRELMEPEPGAIYRIELSFTKDLSAYPCSNSDTQKTKEELMAEDVTEFQREVRQYDSYDNYYYYDYYYDDYDYYYDDDSRKDPCSDRYYYNRKVARNVLASNLGIITKRGNTNELFVVVNNILTTSPEKSVEVTVHNYQNQVIGRGTTDEKGQTRIKIEPNGGIPFYIMASQGEQKSYLRIDDGASLSLSNFDVSGEVVQKGIKGFIYGDRGVWRPGDTLYMSFMLNDRDKTLPDNHPVVMELYNPNGQLYLKRTRNSGELGIYSFELPTDPDVPTGAWNIQVKVGGVTFYKRVRIEAIKPNRLKINLTHSDNIILRGEKYNSKMHVEWLQGATARNLKYEIEGTFTAIPTTFPKYKDYKFDMVTRSFKTETVEIAKGNTDEKGDADIDFKFEIGSSASGMLSASLFTRVYEESGDFSIDGEQIKYSPYSYYAGIKPPKEDDSHYLHTEKEYSWEIASVNHLGNPAPNRKLNVRIYKTDRYWWWSSNSNQLANFLENSHNKPVKEITVTTNSLGVGKVSYKVAREDWGSYFIVAKDELTRHTAGVSAWIDWPGYGGRRDSGEESGSAQTLRFKTDKETYEPGETIRLTIPSTAGSRALVTIENGSKVISANDYTCNAKETIIELTATEEMLPNAYVHVTLLQPHANTNNDLPIRMYGVVPFSVNFAGSHLYPVIQMADEVKPEQNYEVTISEKDGREMAYTLAIVDEGLLDLTRFKTPDPWTTFNAHEALGVTTWDIYNFVVGAYGGRIEQIFSIGGDDDLNAGPKAVVNRFKPVVKFDGPYRLKKGEKKTHKYIMPNYTGRVRVMVVTGDGTAYGNAEKSVMVRKPVMLLGTLPRVIGIGEEMVVPATVFATEDNVGKVKVSIACSDNMEIVGPSSRDLNFTSKDDKQATFRIRVKNKPGAGKVTLIAKGKGENSVYETDIEIRSVRRPQTRSKMVMVEPTKSWEEKIAMPGATGTNKLTLEVSGIMPINLSSRLSYLIGYPHGCVEQITSKAFPQLFLKKFTELNPEQQKITEQAVKDVIMRLRSYLMPSGAFSYWPGGSSSAGWASVYATHFLLQAEAMGYTVPDALKKNALKDLRQLARAWKPSSSDTWYRRSEEFTQAYRLYVLSLAQTPEIGAMNRLKEQTHIYAMTRWTLAASYALVGRTDVANDLITTTEAFTPYRRGYDYTYGSDLRDKAMRLQTLSLLKKTEQANKLAKEISENLSSNNWYSTQSTAFALLSLSDYYGQFSLSDKIEFEYNTRANKDRIQTNSYVWSETLLTEAGTTEQLKVTNKGNSTIFLQIITEGTPDQGAEEAYAKDLSIEVKYVDVNNQLIDVEELEQGVNFSAVVEVKNPTPDVMQNLVLSQIFPAGWEILNTRFLEGGSDKRDPGISYQDIRDDRVYSYIDYLASGKKVTVKINLCTVYPGTFYLPPVWCEAMYDNQVTANTEGKQVVIK